jgi:hypothetical protein
MVGKTVAFTAWFLCVLCSTTPTTTEPTAAVPPRQQQRTRLGECSGQAVGGPGIQPSNHQKHSVQHAKPSRRPYREGEGFKFNLSEQHLQDRKCRDLDTDDERDVRHSRLAMNAPNAEPAAGLEPLFEFARRVQLKPTCDFRKLRSWGGVSIPQDYCSGGEGSDGWTGFDVGGSRSAIGYVCHRHTPQCMAQPAQHVPVHEQHISLLISRTWCCARARACVCVVCCVLCVVCCVCVCVCVCVSSLCP